MRSFLASRIVGWDRDAKLIEHAQLKNVYHQITGCLLKVLSEDAAPSTPRPRDTEAGEEVLEGRRGPGDQPHLPGTALRLQWSQKKTGQMLLHEVRRKKIMM